MGASQKTSKDRSPDPSPINVLLIENDLQTVNRFKGIFAEKDGGYSFALECKDRLGTGLDYLTQGSTNTDIVLLDLSLPDSQGLESLAKVQAKTPLVPIVVVSKQDDEQIALQAVRQGAEDYLVRSEVERQVILHVVRHAVGRKRAAYVLRESERRLQSQMETLNDLVKSKDFESDNLDLMFQEITKVTAKTLQVDRVQIWLYSKERDLLECKALYRCSGGFQTSEEVLESAEHEIYLNALTEVRSLALEHPQKDERTRDFFTSHLSKLEVTSTLDCPIRLKGRIFGFMSCWQTRRVRQWTLEDETFAGSVADLVSLSLAVHERKQVQEQLSRVDEHDAVTKLPNRTLLVERLNRAIVTARQKKSLIGILFVGMDHFKRVNNTLGHAGGDELLRRVAGRLKDTLYPTDMVSRVGGDTFIILLSDVKKTEVTIQIANRITDSFKSCFSIGNHEFFMSASIGVSHYPTDGRESTSLLKNSDTAMFRAKEEGGGCVQLYSPVMNAKALEHLVLENSLRRALERKEFRLYYQPHVDIKTGKITGAEALIRWEHPNLGIISPAEFIPLAEETGLIVPMGEWVLRTACAEAKRWHDSGYRGLNISVNISARQFQHYNLLQEIQNALEETKLDARCLQLELTEGLVMQNTDEAITILREINDMGIQISIDDFGVGYSSLNYLKRFPIRILKIDRSFVRDIMTDSDDAAIVEAIISMAHSLKIEVLAEGVESPGQLNYLKEHGCDKLQGFIFSPPVPAPEFESQLIEEKK